MTLALHLDSSKAHSLSRTKGETSEMETVEGACSFLSNGICHVTLSVSELCRAISLYDAVYVTEMP